VLAPLTYLLCGMSVILLGLAAVYAVRDRIFDDWVLAVSGLIEVGLLVQLVRGLVGMGRIADTAERATFAAYLLTLPVVPVAAVYLAIKEKSRWSMGAVAVGGFAVFIMVVRLQQIWDGHV